MNNEQRSKNIFRSIQVGVFYKNSWLYLTVDHFFKTLNVICFTGLWICLDKTKEKPGVSSSISQKNKTGISAILFLNSISSSHYYVAMRR